VENKPYAMIFSRKFSSVLLSANHDDRKKIKGGIMNVLHLISGNETGGGMVHVLSLLNILKEEINTTLGVFHDEEMAKRARNLGINVHVFKQKSRLDLSITKQIKNYIDDNDIHILHTHGARANFIAQFISKKVRCPWVITVHSDPHDDFLNKGIIGKIFTNLNIRALKSADYIIAISEMFKENLESIGIGSEKIETIFNGINFQIEPKAQYKREDFGLQPDDFVILMVARLEPVKCHEIAFQALKQLLAKSDKFHLMLIGEGSRHNELVKKANEYGISDHVKFLGHRDDATELYTIGDITILTSKSESFPLVLLESARAKKPVITTDVGGVRDLIPTSDYGYIINVGDYTDLAEKIWAYQELKEKGTLHEVGERLFNHASKHFSDEKFAKSVLFIYKKILGKSNE